MHLLFPRVGCCPPELVLQQPLMEVQLLNMLRLIGAAAIFCLYHMRRCWRVLLDTSVLLTTLGWLVAAVGMLLWTEDASAVSL